MNKNEKTYLGWKIFTKPEVIIFIVTCILSITIWGVHLSDLSATNNQAIQQISAKQDLILSKLDLISRQHQAIGDNLQTVFSFLKLSMPFSMPLQ